MEASLDAGSNPFGVASRASIHERGFRADIFISREVPVKDCEYNSVSSNESMDHCSQPAASTGNLATTYFDAPATFNQGHPLSYVRLALQGCII